jgi:large subunit ribosomal protein L18
MSANLSKNLKRLKRKIRIRKKISGTMAVPRMCVFKTAKHIYVQLVDDTTGKTLVSASTLDKGYTPESDVLKKAEKAVAVGKLVAERAIASGYLKVVFDRNGFIYHGRIKALSDSAREKGLKF